MNAADVFFDTNILVYLVSSDLEKAGRSEALLAGGGTVSVQVLNEFASAARRKTKLSFAEIKGILADVRRICAVKPIDVETHELGLDIAERYRFSRLRQHDRCRGDPRRLSSPVQRGSAARTAD